MKILTTIFKSLADETRLRIMGLLLQERELCVCHIIEVLQLPQSTVSRHLATLKKAGWLTDRRSGVWIHYSINGNLSSTHKYLIELLRTILADNEQAHMDRVRLAGLDRDNGCEC